MGDEEFRQGLLAQMKAKRAPGHFGVAVHESEMAKAERVVQKELKRLGWREKELAGQRKGDPKKVRLAMFLRRNTTMTIGWIADRLQMGTPGYLSHLLYWEGKTKPKQKRRKSKY